MGRLVCQSCGMPLNKAGDRGTDKDGAESRKYCRFCYQGGEFTWPDATAERMQTYCMGVLTRQKHWPSFLARLAVSGIPKLERWRQS